MRQERPRSRAPRWPSGLVPWKKTVESFLEKLAAAAGIEIEIIGATRSQGGSALSFEVPSSGTGATALPLDVSSNGIVTPSTIFGVMPTIGGTPLNGSPPPTLSIPSSGTRHVVITISGTPLTTTLSGRIFIHNLNSISVTISLQTTAPNSSDQVSSTGTYKLLLATFVNGAKTAQIGHGPITAGISDDLNGTGTGILSVGYTSP
jgi:hypothetical protein